MIVINYGLYDFFGELEYAAVTLKADTALGIIKTDLDVYLQSEIEETTTNFSLSWAPAKLTDLTESLIELGKITTIEQFIAHELFHYEEWKVSGINNKEV